jgi:hypothetical protein
MKPVIKPLWIVAAVPVLIAVLVAPAVVLARGESGFDGVVGALESRYHTHATRIPFMGLVSMIGRAASHGGVNRMKVADFEEFSAQVDGDELNRLVEEKLGPGWERMIRETSRKGGEQTLIFARQEGSKMGMFIVALDGKDLNVVEISVDPDHLVEQLAHYDHHFGHQAADNGDHNSDSDDDSN